MLYPLWPTPTALAHDPTTTPRPQVKLLHTHEKSGRRGVLSSRAVDFLRRFYADDLRCIRYLCKRGWLPDKYFEGITNKSKVYPY